LTQRPTKPRIGVSTSPKRHLPQYDHADLGLVDDDADVGGPGSHGYHVADVLTVELQAG
jgi:hypothetical protein